MYHFIRLSDTVFFHWSLDSSFNVWFSPTLQSSKESTASRSEYRADINSFSMTPSIWVMKVVASESADITESALAKALTNSFSRDAIYFSKLYQGWNLLESLCQMYATYYLNLEISPSLSYLRFAATVATSAYTKWMTLRHVAIACAQIQHTHHSMVPSRIN